MRSLIPKKDQSVKVQFDFGNKKVYVYSNRKEVNNRLKKYLGDPKETWQTEKGEELAITYELDFDDKNLKKVLSISNILSATRYYRRKK